MTDCLTDSDLNRYHAGELDEGAEARVREHLAKCQQCAQRDAELVALHEELLGRVKGMKLSEAPGDQPRLTQTKRRERDGQGRGDDLSERLAPAHRGVLGLPGRIVLPGRQRRRPLQDAEDEP